MDENSTSTPNSIPTHSRWSFVTNPFLMGVITLVGLPLGVWGIYLTLAFNKEAKPVYRILSDVVVSDRQASPKIKVYYDSIEVQNVRAVTVAIWNAGNTYIDKSAFAQDRPISIVSSKPVSVLDAKQVATTSTGLAFLTKISADQITGTPADTTTKRFDYVTTQIKGDDGLEADDGATFVVLYTTSAKQNAWSVRARVKGIPEGFAEVVDPKKELNPLFPALGLYGAILVGIIPYHRMYRRRKRTFKKERSILAVFALMFVVPTFYLFYKEISSMSTISIPDILLK